MFWEGVVGCDLPCARTYPCFPCVCCFPASAKWVLLLFSGRCDLPCARTYACFPYVCHSPACAKRVALCFAAGCDLPCARRVALFSGRKLLSATCLAQGGSHFFSERELLDATCLPGRILVHSGATLWSRFRLW